MSIEIEYLPEPKLQFGDFFEHEDTKTGLAEFGPFGKNVTGLHPSEIRLGFIGTRETISGAREWVEQCGSPIESENKKNIAPKQSPSEGRLFGDGLFDDDSPEDAAFMRLYKILNRDFIGFSRETEFSCCFQVNDRWERVIQPLEIKRILDIENKQNRIWELVDLFDGQIKSLAETKPSPDIVLLCLTKEMTDAAHAVQVTGSFYLNFRRAIKARAMKWGIPIQLMQRGTILGKKSAGRRGPLQEKATRAWNFCTAMYYKADGVPWRPTSFQQDTCFIGIDFLLSPDENGGAVRSNMAALGIGNTPG